MLSNSWRICDRTARSPEILSFHQLTDLPSQIGDLEREASEEGFNFLGRLVADWQTGSNRFDKRGECLLAVT